MPHTQNLQAHPNRVFVKELPKDLDRNELQHAFSGFGVTIRAARVVQTKGETNYGFLTFDSAQVANEIIRAAKDQPGIVVRGKRVVVDHAFSRKGPTLRKNSGQFSQALQGICSSMNQSMNAATDAQQYPESQPHNYHHAMSPSTDHGYHSPPNQAYPGMHTPGHYGSMWHDGQSVYITPQRAAPGQSVPYPHGVYQDDARSTAHWSAHGAYHHQYDTTKHHQARYGGIDATQMPTHYQEVSGQWYVKNPAEGVEAPHMMEWCHQTESANIQRTESETPTAFHHHNQDKRIPTVQQLQSYQTQLMQQHAAHQHMMYSMHYAQQQQSSSPRSDSEGSNH